MTAFLIVMAVIVAVFAFILSIRATFFITYDNGWSTRIKVLFFEKDIKLSELLNFVLFPKETAEVAAENNKNRQVKQKRITRLTRQPFHLFRTKHRITSWKILRRKATKILKNQMRKIKRLHSKNRTLLKIYTIKTAFAV